MKTFQGNILGKIEGIHFAIIREFSKKNQCNTNYGKLGDVGHFLFL